MSDSTTPEVIHAPEHNHWYKKLTDYPANRENPFLAQVVSELKVVVKRQTLRPKNGGGNTDLMLVDGVGTEHGEATFQTTKEVDIKEFTKMYHEGVVAAGGLSVRGTKVWYYIFDELQVGATSFHFMVGKCLEHTGYKTRGNILSGLAELLAASIIARSQDSSLYFINPAYMFNGDRVTFAKTYIKKQLKEKYPTQHQLELNPNMSFTDLRKLLKDAEGGASV
jgi:hypothetical protein